MKKVLITGGVGFVGTNMVHMINGRYPSCHCVIFDNFSTGSKDNIQCQLLPTPAENTYIVGDLTHDIPDQSLCQAMAGSDIVFHFAANADIRNGPTHRQRDLDQNIQATLNVLEAMVATGVQKIVFTSTAPVYGEHPEIPTPEDASFPVQTSLYAASKLAAEGYITSFCNYFGLTAYIFRPVSMLGPYYSHGHVIDFVRQLQAHPDYLDILGNGRARKSYIHVTDACNAMLHVVNHPNKSPVQIYNLGLPEYITVEESARIICREMTHPESLTDLRFQSKEERGWPGDVPFVYLNVERLLLTGWKPTHTLRDAIRDTVLWLVKALQFRAGIEQRNRLTSSSARKASAPGHKSG
jgi:UDP-glucose 4-epimerase